VVAFLRRQEIRNCLASLDDKARHEFVSKHAASNPDIGMAILEMPTEFTRVAGTDRELLVEATLEATHGEKLAELRELERAIEVANSAVEAGWENQMHEAGVFDLKKWDEAVKDVKPARPVPWLRKNGGKIVCIKRNAEGGLSGPQATEEELADGQYSASREEWERANATL
jgi:hypothetical protein